MSTELDLIGVGNAIVDVISQSTDTFLVENNLNKGAMTLIEADMAEELYGKMGPGMEVSGGSAANTIAAFASLGGKGGFIGKVANDQLGNVFEHDIRASGVEFATSHLSDGLPTSRCLIHVTPDAERTMCTFLGASVWLTPSDIDEELVKSAQVTYLEGYLFDRPKSKQAFLKVAKVAHEADRKVALSLSDPFCVDRHRDEFFELISEHIDILFANEEEIKSLFQVKDFETALEKAKDICEVCALTRGANGSVILSGDQRIDVPVVPVSRIVDTTGAGDLYAAGFLYGYTRGETLAVCGDYASKLAAEVIQQIGARPQRNLMDVLDAPKVANG